MGFWDFFKRKANKNVKVALALGGGGARGFAHIGALKAFEELGIEISMVAGTSVGSIVGAGIAYGLSAQQMIDVATKIKKKDVVTSKFFFSVSTSENLEEFLGSLIGKDTMFSELKKPLCVVAVDMKTGREVVIDHGFVCQACAGSAAVPGVFKPVVWEDMHLVDGGLKNNVPADVARKMGADVVFAIDVNHTRGKGTHSLKMFSLLSSMVGVMMQSNVDDSLKFADVALFPDLTKFKSTKLENVTEMIQIGYDCVMENKNEILKLVSKKPSKRKKKLWQKRMENE